MKAGLALAAMLAAWPATGAAAQEVDSALARVERLIVVGDRASARGVIDSLVAALPAEYPRLGDVLYWRGASASNAADAERDYLRVSVEHPFVSRAPDALMALAQLEFARGDRTAARRRYDRLLRDYPSGRHVPRASLLAGRLAIEEGDAAAGCVTLSSARAHVPPTDIELGNQFDYYLGQCSRLRPAGPDTLVPAAQGTGTPGAGTGPAAAQPSTQYSVQVAAYSARRDATALANRLKARGFDVRVVGSRAPYRVRIGRYDTRPDAVSALGRIQRSGVKGIVVEAEPR